MTLSKEPLHKRDLAILPSYEKKVWNFKNQIIDNVFTDLEMLEIMTMSLNSRDVVYKPDVGQKLYRFKAIPKIKEKLEKIIQELSGYENFYLLESSYCVYQSVYRDQNNIQPDLPEHYDINMGGPRLTLDVQSFSNTDWEIFVEDERFSLKDNQALFFSGTDQIHSRPKKHFNYDEYLHMIFFHFGEK
jgi:hypothetical protein